MKAALFDLDGVIVSTDIYHYQAWKEIARKYGLEFDYKVNHKLRGVSRAESLQIILDKNCRVLNGETFEAILIEKNAIYNSLLDNISPADILDGVIDLFDDLKANGIKIGIGSSSRNTHKILERLGLHDVFDIVVDGNAISKSKPDPEVFLLGAKGLGIETKDCTVIEDAQAGIDAALAAGMIAVGVGNDALIGTHLLLRNLDDIDFSKLSRIVRK